MLMKLFCRQDDRRQGTPSSVVVIVIIDIIIPGSVLRLQQRGQPGDRPGRGRQQRGGKEQSHGRGPGHGTGDGGTAGPSLYPTPGIYLSGVELPKPVRLLLCLPTRPCVSMFRREDDNFHPLLVTCDLLPRSHWSKYKFGTCIEDIQTSELEKWLTNLLPFVSVFPRSLLSAKQTYIS